MSNTSKQWRISKPASKTGSKLLEGTVYPFSYFVLGLLQVSDHFEFLLEITESVDLMFGTSLAVAPIS